QLREKQTANLEPWKDWNEKPKIIPAIEWLANVMMKPEAADDWPVFRIDHPELIALLKLPQKDKQNHQDGKHYAWNQIQPSFDVMTRFEPPLLVPPHHSKSARDDWMRVGETLLEAARGETIHPAVRFYAAMASALRQGRADEFNRTVAEYRAFLAPNFAPEL